MLKWRARSFGLRDQFSDALRGIANAEELMDRPAIDVDSTTMPVPRPLFEDVRPTETKPKEASTPSPPPPSEERAVPPAGPKLQSEGPAHDPERPVVGGTARASKPQDEVASLVTELGYTYDDLRRCAEANHWPVELGSFGSFTDLPERATTFLLRNREGLKLALKSFKGVK
jgi:hypothetical protein